MWNPWKHWNVTYWPSIITHDGITIHPLGSAATNRRLIKSPIVSLQWSCQKRAENGVRLLQEPVGCHGWKFLKWSNITHSVSCFFFFFFLTPSASIYFFYLWATCVIHSSSLIHSMNFHHSNPRSLQVVACKKMGNCRRKLQKNAKPCGLPVVSS